MVSIKGSLRGTFIGTQAYPKKQSKNYWIDNLTWHLKQLDKIQEQQQQREKI